jgi:hypothetical protein
MSEITQKQYVQSSNTTSNSGSTPNGIVHRLFDCSNLYISQTNLREPLLENSPEAETRRRRRMSMIHQEVYINTTRTLSSIVDTATRKINSSRQYQHGNNESIVTLTINQQEQQERDDDNNNSNTDCQQRQINTNVQYIDCDSDCDHQMKNNNTTTTKRSKFMNKNQFLTSAVVPVANSNNTSIPNSHLHRILRIPSIKILPSFHRFRPNSIDTSQSHGTNTTMKNDDDEERLEYDPEVVSNDDIIMTSPSSSETASSIVVTPPLAPRNQQRLSILNCNDVSSTVGRFFPSP